MGFSALESLMWVSFSPVHISLRLTINPASCLCSASSYWNPRASWDRLQLPTKNIMELHHYTGRLETDASWNSSKQWLNWRKMIKKHQRVSDSPSWSFTTAAFAPVLFPTGTADWWVDLACACLSCGLLALDKMDPDFSEMCRNRAMSTSWNKGNSKQIVEKKYWFESGQTQGKRSWEVEGLRSLRYWAACSSILIYLDL